MKYIKLIIEIKEDYQEPLIAELFDIGFDGFEQHELVLVGYISKEEFSIGDREHIERLLAGFPGNSYIQSEEIVAEQNWNEQWEQTVRAQQIGRFFVKPTWSAEKAPDESILLEIDPKMSFGTGYHETTRLILRMLPDLIRPDIQVIDAGTGTGILSIAAIKLGAEHAFAFDIDEWSIQNARENILLNGVEEKVTVKRGSSEVIPERPQADLLLANIEKNIILKLLPDFIRALKPGGDLVLSGLLQADRELIFDRLSEGAEVVNIQQENEWIAVHAKANQ